MRNQVDARPRLTGRSEKSASAFERKSLVLSQIGFRHRSIGRSFISSPKRFWTSPMLMLPCVGHSNPRYTVSSPMTVNQSPKVAPRCAPNLGEHTDQVLSEIGFDSSEIKAFRANAVIPQVSHAAA